MVITRLYDQIVPFLNKRSSGCIAHLINKSHDLLSTQFQHKTKYLYNLVHIILFWKNHQYFYNIFFYYTSSPFASLWKGYFWRFSFFHYMHSRHCVPFQPGEYDKVKFEFKLPEDNLQMFQFLWPNCVWNIFFPLNLFVFWGWKFIPNCSVTVPDGSWYEQT